MPDPDGSEAARIKNPLLSLTQPFQILKVFIDDVASPLVAPLAP